MSTLGEPHGPGPAGRGPSQAHIYAQQVDIPPTANVAQLKATIVASTCS